MRYIIKPQQPTLVWLEKHAPQPRVYPTKPSDSRALVVAHLFAGKVVAEVIPNRAAFPAACGSGVPLGRLYFQVPKELLYGVCPELKPTSFF
jgi:hypothetical protein